MGKINLQDITSAVIYNDKTFSYKLKTDLLNLSHFHQELLKNKIGPSQEILLPTISGIVTECYPFIEKRNLQLINQIIERNKKINNLIFHAISTKRGMELNFDPLEEKDKFILGLAKSVCFDLNKFIYKYEISNLYPNKTFINADINNLYLGNIDLIAQGKNCWYLITFKMSRSGYNQKYFAELFLQKQAFENNTKFKIQECFIFNPREQRVVVTANEISGGEIYKINNLIKNS